MMSDNYILDVMNGEAMLDDIDAYVTFWHESQMKESLQDFLGFSDNEYTKWMNDGNYVVRDILFCRRNGIDFETFSGEQYREKGSVPEVLNKYRASA